MRLFLLTSVAMLAFAANSLLNRVALAEGLADPMSFAAVRLAAGALMLVILLAWRGDGWAAWQGWQGWQPWGALSLALYVLGFSWAYVSLDAGAGALILFGGVQITMFAGALIAREPVPVTRWVGALIAFGGLVYLLVPVGPGALDPAGAAMMAAAALGWGVYSLLGRGVTDPTAATARNFVLAVPLGLLVFALAPDRMTLAGAGVAVVSGALTSGLGYALWYRAMPRLGASRAAVAQLSVPLLAMFGGAVMLSEGLDLRLLVAAALVLGGIGLSLIPVRR